MDIGLHASTHGPGYRESVGVFDCPSGQRQELEDQRRQFSEQVLPHAAGRRAEGGWKTGL